MNLFRQRKILSGIIFINLWMYPAFPKASDSVLIEKIDDPMVIYFRFNQSVIDKKYMDNASNLLRLDSLLHCKVILMSMDSLTIKAYASPEGHPTYNQKLALDRAVAVKEYMITQQPYLSSIPITTISMGENWDGLRELIEKDFRIPAKEAVLSILNNKTDYETKEKQLKKLSNNKAWYYIEENLLRYLRESSCVLFYLDSVKVTKADTIDVVNPPIIASHDIEIVSESSTTLENPMLAIPKRRTIRPIALKTNMLFNAAMALNVEVEIPIGKRVSFAGEWIFPWWLWEKKQNCIEVLSGNLEARYWFRPNYTKQDPSLGLHNPITGWFAGIYGGGGLYDLEWKREGYQGEFFIATGISSGYVLPLSRNINMEFSLGFGFMRTKYRHYHAQHCELKDHWHLIKQHSGQYTWIGPTRAKISFIWYPHFKVKKKGGSL